MTVRAILVGLLLLGVAMPGMAQVGHLPERSPYRDLRYPREWTFVTGYYSAARDPVGVAPGSGPMAGGRYDMRLGGPAYLSGRVMAAFVERRVLDPRQPEDERIIGEESVPLLFTDLALGLNLTGFRTWRGFAPTMSAGVGFTADLSGGNDVGNYRFGAPFTMNFGAGFKWTAGGRWQVRGDWVNYIYQIRYPNSYYINHGTGDPVRGVTQRRELWRRNVSFQVGLSYLTGR
ncbi:MAG TPA: hypothetical protein VLE53_14830 [Gemmatimonadaceae bacterium]|nr:hypothetical protein [Gemmatimonadaceae bacterium]